jgi:hypothetical protein
MRDVPVVGDHLIELLVVRAMGAFEVTVESGRFFTVQELEKVIAN